MSVQAINGLLRRIPTWVLYLGGLVPFGLLVWGVLGNTLGPDPVKAVERQLGEVALQLLVAGLCVTPLRRLTGISLIRFRRALGLLAFLYVALHLSAWVFLDLAMRWGEIGADLVKRPYIIVGMLAFVLMVPLALTSNAAAIRRLGPQSWQRLHRLTYLVCLAGGLHFIMLTKTWAAEPLLYAGVILALLVLRVAPFASPRLQSTR